MLESFFADGGKLIRYVHLRFSTQRRSNTSTTRALQLEA